MPSMILNCVVFIAGIGIVLAAGYFSRGGLKAVQTLSYWAVVGGAAVPGLLSLGYLYLNRFESDDPALALGMLFLALLIELFISLIVSFWMVNPTSLWQRALIGFGIGLFSGVLALWLK